MGEGKYHIIKRKSLVKGNPLERGIPADRDIAAHRHHRRRRFRRAPAPRSGPASRHVSHAATPRSRLRVRHVGETLRGHRCRYSHGFKWLYDE